LSSVGNRGMIKKIYGDLSAGGGRGTVKNKKGLRKASIILQRKGKRMGPVAIYPLQRREGERERRVAKCQREDGKRSTQDTEAN